MLSAAETTDFFPAKATDVQRHAKKSLFLVFEVRQANRYAKSDHMEDEDSDFGSTTFDEEDSTQN